MAKNARMLEVGAYGADILQGRANPLARALSATAGALRDAHQPYLLTDDTVSLNRPRKMDPGRTAGLPFAALGATNG